MFGTEEAWPAERSLPGCHVCWCAGLTVAQCEAAGVGRLPTNLEHATVVGRALIHLLTRPLWLGLAYVPRVFRSRKISVGRNA
eukprot:COSAG01_NODE_5639_length_4125_cov_16.441288_3_plen_83_part_00